MLITENFLGEIDVSNNAERVFIYNIIFMVISLMEMYTF